MSGDNFTFNVTGDNSQNVAKNEGKMTQTIIGAGGNAWQPAQDAATEPEQAQAVETMREVIEAYPEPAEWPEEEISRFEGALSFLKQNGPTIAKIAGKTALSLIPAGNAVATLIETTLEEIG